MWVVKIYETNDYQWQIRAGLPAAKVQSIKQQLLAPEVTLAEHLGDADYSKHWQSRLLVVEIHWFMRFQQTSTIYEDSDILDGILLWSHQRLHLETWYAELKATMKHISTVMTISTELSYRKTQFYVHWTKQTCKCLHAVTQSPQECWKNDKQIASMKKKHGDRSINTIRLDENCIYGVDRSILLPLML